MTHPDRKKAKFIDMPGRCRAFTDIVYSGVGNSKEMWAEMHAAERRFDPAPNPYHAYIGEMHGHTNLSDGSPDIDTYFKNLRDLARVDFAAISDHDHGGVGKPELWVGSPSKWDLTREKVKEYYEPGKFTTILAYERDSYPFCNNMIVYYNSHDGEMIRSEHDGEITEAEMRAVLARDDVFVVPHDTYYLSSGCDFNALPLDLMPPFLELYARGDAAEYMGNPGFAESNCCEGGFWQDALNRGARMGCIGGSDDHSGNNGRFTDAPYPFNCPGLTGVWAEENTLESLFAALKAKRCYTIMGGRMELDLRINGHFMGEEFTLPADEDRAVWFSVRADAPIKAITVVKNGRDYYRQFKGDSQLFFDYRQEKPTDYYYLRVELTDGRFGWTSPVWVTVRPE